jgi:tetraacyldisaccharide 4'-kinase
VKRSAHNRVDDIWYGSSPLSWLLMPLSLLFSVAVAVRRFAYARRWRKSVPVGVPVVVVGNISVGGTGKTPVTIWLALALRHRGYQPAIISRGYGGNVGAEPVVATPDSDTDVVGDEAVLLATQGQCPVVVHPDRVAAAEKAIALGADIVVSDDGLQHYRLERDFEIIVVDGSRGFGNERLLPAGPLREPHSRLSEVDVVIVHRTPGVQHEVLRRSTDRPPLQFRMRVNAVMRLDASEVRHIDDFSGKTVHAVAGIGHPERFFSMLESHGVQVIRHPLADHATIEPRDIDFDDDKDVLMTQKDAVKCRWLDTAKCWYVPVDVEFEEGDAERLLTSIERIASTAGADRH